MNFISNRIVNPVGDGISFDDWLQKVSSDQNKKVDKIATEAKPECDGDPRGQCRGQNINNDPNYQKGESVDGKASQDEGKSKTKAKKESSSQKKVSHCEKDMGECSKAGDTTEKHSPAANAAKEKGKVEQNINNDPNYQKGESVNLKKKDKDSGKKKESSSDAKKNSFNKISTLGREQKIQLFANLSSTKTNPLPYVEAMVGIKFANLTEDEKGYLRKFWLTLYPRDYVEHMIEDR